MPRLSFSLLPDCAKEEIRRAFNSWAEIGNIQFEEIAKNSTSYIKVSVAEIHVSGIGFPNFPESPCDQLAGNIIIKSNTSANNDCHDCYIFALHEIGHVLG